MDHVCNDAASRAPPAVHAALSESYPDEIHAAALHGYASQPCEAMRRAQRAIDARQMMHLQLGWPARTSSRMRPA